MNDKKKRFYEEIGEPYPEDPDPVRSVQEAEPAPTPATGRVPSVERRLWRGDVSLVVTFWFYYVFGNALLGGIDRGIDSAGVYDNVSGLGTIIFAFAILTLLYFAFTAVCVWRSANKYSRANKATGRAFWGSVAKVFVVLGVVRFVIGF